MKEFRIPLTDIVPCTDIDNARLHKTGYIDTQHTRFYNNLPMSMGGFRLISSGNSEIVRGITSVPQTASFDLYLGRASTLSYINYTLQGIGNPEIDRTPSGFTVDPNNLWNFATLSTIVDSVSTKFIYAHAAPNALDINNIEDTPVYYGDQSLNTPLVPLLDSDATPVSVSGGICTSGPYIFVYGDFIAWSNSNAANVIPTQNISYIAGSKVIQGLPTTGGGVPGVLFWTSNSLIRGSFYSITVVEDVVTTDFVFEIIPGITSLLAQNSVVVLDNVFYWLGVDSFFSFTGVLSVLPNTTSLLYFYKNVNKAAANKIFGFARPKFGEVVWLWPSGNSLENNMELVYSKLTNQFFINKISRSCGLAPSSGFSYPIMCDSTTRQNLSVPIAPNQTPAQVYGIWQHEYQTDEYFYNFTFPIEKYFETKIYSINNGAQMMRSTRMIPNFVQTGPMDLVINTRNFPNSPVVHSETYTFDENTLSVATREMGTFTSYRFSSNTLGGSFLGGQTMIVAEGADPGVRS